MTTQAPAFSEDDREFYPLHEEDDVPETEFHDLRVDYLCDAFRGRSPSWRVFRNMGVYWERGNVNAYRAPDIFVVREPIPEPFLRVYITWRDPPVLFVAEVGDRSPFREDEGPQLEVYARLVKAREYLYYDPGQALARLWKMGTDGAYEEVVPGANGRLWSMELGLGFAVEAGFLRVYTPAGVRLRSHCETERDRIAAGARAAAATQRREIAELARLETEARAAEAAARAATEAERHQVAERERQEAEAGAKEEARQREAAEARAAEERALREELERQLAAVQDEIEGRGDGVGTPEAS
jgi:hypothetical protein